MTQEWSVITLELGWKTKEGTEPELLLMYISVLPLTSAVTSLTAAEVLPQIAWLSGVKRKGRLLRACFPGQTLVAHYSEVNQTV